MALWGPDNPLYSRSSYSIFPGRGEVGCSGEGVAKEKNKLSERVIDIKS